MLDLRGIYPSDTPPKLGSGADLSFPSTVRFARISRSAIVGNMGAPLDIDTFDDDSEPLSLEDAEPGYAEGRRRSSAADAVECGL